MTSSPASTRLAALDATRAVAMLGVYLSHSSELLRGTTHSALIQALLTLGMMATPTFLLLSGAVCAHLASSGRQSPEQYRWRLIDRGLFLLIVAHVALSATHAPYWGWSTSLFNCFWVTDAVGLSLLVAGALGANWSRRAALGVAISLAAVSLLVSTCYAPHADIARSLLRLSFGSLETPDDADGWIVPAVPYLAMFALGYAFGHARVSERLRDATGTLQVASLALRLGVIAIVSALLLKIVGTLWTQAGSPPHGAPLVMFTSLRQKVPPGLAYWLLFGGGGLLSFAAVATLMAKRMAPWLTSRLATAGRSSLVVFIAQFWLTSVPPRVLHAETGLLTWLIAVPVSIAGLWLLAEVWDRHRGNRLYTVGLKYLVRRLSSRPLYSAQSRSERLPHPAVQRP